MVLTKDNVSINFAFSSNVNGPDQGTSGMKFGTTYLYIKIPGGMWYKVQRSRSSQALRSFISTITASELQEAIAKGLI